MEKINYTISDKLICRKLNNEYVILNDNNGTYYSLNEIGSLIWEFISKKHNFNIDDIINFCLNKFEIDKKTLEKDILELINDLKNEKIIY